MVSLHHLYVWLFKFLNTELFDLWAVEHLHFPVSFYGNFSCFIASCQKLYCAFLFLLQFYYSVCLCEKELDQKTLKRLSGKLSIHSSIYQCDCHLRGFPCSLFILPFCWAQQLQWMWAIQPTKRWLIVCLQWERMKTAGGGGSEMGSKSSSRGITVHASSEHVQPEEMAV